MALCFNGVLCLFVYCVITLLLMLTCCFAVLSCLVCWVLYYNFCCVIVMQSCRYIILSTIRVGFVTDMNV